jgi:hypothetical protein
MDGEQISTMQEQAPPEPVETQDDFSALLAEDTGEGIADPTPEGPPAAAEPVGGQSGATPVVGTPGAQATPQAPPVPTPAAAVGEVPPPPTPAAAPAVQAPAAAPAQTLEQMRENIVTEVASRYAMPPEVRDQFMLNPEQVLPQMAARLYVDIYDAVFNSVMAQIPQVMSSREQQVRAAQASEARFFERWPALRDPQFTRDIVAMGRAYRQQNPQATPEQAIEAIGAMVSVAKGVALPGAGSASPPQMRPPTPIGPGMARAAAPVAPQRTIWDELSSMDE